jgi:aminoglycoside 3-N-acetyltransferase
MPRPEIIAARTPVTRSALATDLRRLGLGPGMTVMVHTALSSLGWVVGGSQTVVQALLDCVGEAGTLCAQASWEDVPFGLAEWPANWQQAYEAELPPFDPALAGAAPYVGRMPERLRTWPGARRSANPATGIVAVGARAAALTAGHRLDDSFGAGTPYARIVEAAGVVLLLGAPLHSISLLHHAEAIARAPKRWTTYRLPLLRDGARQWVQIREIDVWRGVYPYAQRDEPLAAIAAAARAAGAGRRGRVGAAEAHLFDGRALVAFAVQWLEARFAPAVRTVRPVT